MSWDKIYRLHIDKEAIENKRCHWTSHSIVSGCTNKKFHPGRYVLKLLSERKLTQVDVQYVMKETSNFMKSEVMQELTKLQRMMEDEGCELRYLTMIEQIKEEYKKKSFPWFTKPVSADQIFH